MLSVTADAAKRKFGETLRLAEDFPLAITRHGRPRYVLMSAQLFEALDQVRLAHAENRIVVTLDAALARLARGEDEEAHLIIRDANALMGRFLALEGKPAFRAKRE